MEITHKQEPSHPFWTSKGIILSKNEPNTEKKINKRTTYIESNNHHYFFEGRVEILRMEVRRKTEL